MSTALRGVALLFPCRLLAGFSVAADPGLGVTGWSRRPSPGRPPLPGDDVQRRNPPEREGGDSVGVVWGEGDSAATQCGPAIGAGISAWIERLIRAAWRRLFMHGGEL